VATEQNTEQTICNCYGKDANFKQILSFCHLTTYIRCKFSVVVLFHLGIVISITIKSCIISIVLIAIAIVRRAFILPHDYVSWGPSLYFLYFWDMRFLYFIVGNVATLGETAYTHYYCPHSTSPT